MMTDGERVMKILDRSHSENRSLYLAAEGQLVDDMTERFGKGELRCVIITANAAMYAWTNDDLEVRVRLDATERGFMAWAIYCTDKSIDLPKWEIIG